VTSSITEDGLAENWERIDYVSHSEVLRYQKCSKVLLVSINNTPNATGILPGKFFEYLASGRPILAIGPKKSDIGTVLSKTSAGVIVERDDFAGIKDAVWALFKEQNTARQEAEIAKFSRQGLTEELAQIIQRVTN
ncbi:MAG: glycosyl transferase family 1, partial [Flavobacteriales bacterium]